VARVLVCIIFIGIFHLMEIETFSVLVIRCRLVAHTLSFSALVTFILSHSDTYKTLGTETRPFTKSSLHEAANVK
jgi:hypothetical protein